VLAGDLTAGIIASTAGLSGSPCLAAILPINAAAAWVRESPSLSHPFYYILAFDMQTWTVNTTFYPDVWAAREIRNYSDGSSRARNSIKSTGKASLAGLRKKLDLLPRSAQTHYSFCSTLLRILPKKQ